MLATFIHTEARSTATPVRTDQRVLLGMDELKATKLEIEGASATAGRPSCWLSYWIKWFLFTARD